MIHVQREQCLYREREDEAGLKTLKIKPEWKKETLSLKRSYCKKAILLFDFLYLFRADTTFYNTSVSKPKLYCIFNFII